MIYRKSLVQSMIGASLILLAGMAPVYAQKSESHVHGAQANTEITNIAVFTGRPERAGELGALLTGLIADSRREPGCIQYEIHQSVADPAKWMAYERWADQAAFDAHVASPHVQSLLTKLPNLLVGKLEMGLYRRIAE